MKWITHGDLAINRRPTVRREEYLDHMTFQTNERPLFTEIFGPLVGLKEEWEAQGATPEELDFSAFTYRCHSVAFLPVATRRMGGRPEVVLEDTPERKIYTDDLGRTMHLPKGWATLALPQSYPVATMDDWLKIKPLYEFSGSRVPGDLQPWVAKAHEEGHVVVAGIPGGFDETRELMGEENLCVAYYEDPELIHDILQTLSDTAFQVLELATRQVSVDVLTVHEDMAGKSGPLIGPDMIREFLSPYYRRVWNLLRERGARIFDQDSDGDMNPVIDAFLEAGVNCMHPMEPAAGMDIVKVREKFGDRLAFYGGIDKHVLRGTKEDIRRELEYKIPPMLQTGGCVLALDHRVTNGTPLENYRYYIDTVWEIIAEHGG